MEESSALVEEIAHQGLADPVDIEVLLKRLNMQQRN
jgi:hypothetical protein